MSTIADERYVRLTTFTRAGERKETPVWIADLSDGKVGFTTGLGSWKVKRIANTPTVELVGSNSKGKVAAGATTASGTAEVVQGEEFEAVLAAIKSKYGFQRTIVKVVAALGKLIGKGEASDCAVVITLT